MTPSPPSEQFDITAAPRAVLRESVRLLYRILGEDRLGSARDNAWAAVCADRQRANERDAVSRALASAIRRGGALPAGEVGAASGPGRPSPAPRTPRRSSRPGR